MAVILVASSWFSMGISRPSLDTSTGWCVSSSKPFCSRIESCMDGFCTYTFTHSRFCRSKCADSVQIDLVPFIGEKEKGNGVIVCNSCKTILSKQSSGYSVECFRRDQVELIEKWREDRIFPARKRSI